MDGAIFYLLIPLNCKVRLNCWLLIRKMRSYFSKICDLSLFAYNFSFFLFVVLFECIQMFVYVGLLQDRIFGCLFHNCIKRLFVYFLNF